VAKKKRKPQWFEVGKDPILKAQLEQQRKEEEHRLKMLFLPLGAQRFKTPEFVIDNLLPKGYLAILAGDPKSGKTALATAIALAVANGEPFAGHKTRKSPVLWLSLEESPAERGALLEKHLQGIDSIACLDEHCERMFGPNDNETAPVESKLDSLPPIYTCFEPIRIDTEQGIEDLRFWVRETGAALIVVDPLHAAHSGRSLQDGWAARKTLQPLKRFCAQMKVACIVLHHSATRGRERVAENAQLAATASMFMLLSSSPAPKDSNAKRRVTLKCSGRGEFSNTIWHFASDGPLDYRKLPAEVAEPPVDDFRHETLEEKILGVLSKNEAMAASEIAVEVASTPGAVRNAIIRLRGKKKVRLAFIGSGAHYYALPVQEPLPAPIPNEDNSGDSGDGGDESESELKFESQIEQTTEPRTPCLKGQDRIPVPALHPQEVSFPSATCPPRPP